MHDLMWVEQHHETSIWEWFIQTISGDFGWFLVLHTLLLLDKYFWIAQLQMNPIPRFQCRFWIGTLGHPHVRNVQKTRI